MSSWKPSSSVEVLKQRANLLLEARNFFSERDVLEVETPLLSLCTVTEPNIESIDVLVNEEKRYLQTSPEYAMKRLLAGGMSDCYQICKSFRLGEQGSLHNPEFTLIEWYRLKFSLEQIMIETVELISRLLFRDISKGQAEYISYKDAFQNVFNVSVDVLSENELKEIALRHGLVSQENFSRDQYLDFVFSQCVVPTFKNSDITVVFHYPASQAALAQLNKMDSSVAERFEVFFQGIELANGYLELVDAPEQLARFKRDQKVRSQRSLPVVEIEERLIDAMNYGLPSCAGVAVGFDRVLMLAARKTSISEVISFDWSAA